MALDISKQSNGSPRSFSAFAVVNPEQPAPTMQDFGKAMSRSQISFRRNDRYAPTPHKTL
jgi:hypothetical protein